MTRLTRTDSLFRAILVGLVFLVILAILVRRAWLRNLFTPGRLVVLDILVCLVALFILSILVSLVGLVSRPYSV